MAAEIFNGLAQAIGACFGWYQDLMESLGFAGIVIGAFTILTISRFLLKPLTGGGVGQSDKVKKRKGGGVEETDG